MPHPQILTPEIVGQVVLNLQHQGLSNPRLRVYLNNTQLDLQKFGVCGTRGLPAIQVGQEKDCRWPLNGGMALHAHWYKSHVDFHVDEWDPEKHPVLHTINETDVPRGAFIGMVVGLVATSTAESKTTSFWGAALGSVVGAAIGYKTTGMSPTIRVLDVDERGQLVARSPEQYRRQASNVAQRSVQAYLYRPNVYSRMAIIFGYLRSDT